MLTGRGDALAGLGYWNGTDLVGIEGTTSTNPNNDVVHRGLRSTYTVLDGDSAIGNRVAVTIRTPAGSNYPEVDN